MVRKVSCIVEMQCTILYSETVLVKFEIWCNFEGDVVHYLTCSFRSPGRNG